MSTTSNQNNSQPTNSNIEKLPIILWMVAAAVVIFTIVSGVTTGVFSVSYVLGFLLASCIVGVIPWIVGRVRHQDLIGNIAFPACVIIEFIFGATIAGIFALVMIIVIFLQKKK